MKRYERYKDSGVEWLGEVPEHWRVLRGKWIFKKENRPVNTNDEIITCFRDGQVTLRSNRRTEGFTNALKEIGYQGVENEDLVIHNMDAFAGAIGVSDSKGKATPVYSVCTPFKYNVANPFYYAYLLRCFALNGLIISLAKGIRERSTDFRYSDFGSLEYYVPTLNEQNRIVAFLNERCAKIDKAIEQKVQMIELLNERRQIIIQRAVTRGLNSDAPLKDSGIDWIGQIPSHWQVVTIKRIVTVKDGTHETPLYVEPSKKSYPLITSKDFDNDFINFDHAKHISENDYKEIIIRSNTEKFDVLMSMIGGNIGKSLIVSKDAKFAIKNVALFKTQANRLLAKHILYYLKSGLLDIQISLKSRGGAQDFLGLNDIRNLIFVKIPNNEIVHIINYLDYINEKTEQAISLKKQEIEQLKEYKQVLINSAVTGKIKIE